ncbi:hypothetical protein F4818DRAFT_420329 [Hypoxylon cercidicola]|nr:hypothetical protein F4818DRAFT_420329 [Hypoxylon cercidicola]
MPLSPNPNSHCEKIVLSSPVQVTDADILIRKCDFLTIQDDLLHLIMFPRSRPDIWESEIRWMVNNLRHTLEKQRSNFRKVCTEYGTPVRFACWTLEQSEAPQVIESLSSPKQNDGVIPNPDTLDMDA